jgi:hypothetical protein
MRATNNGTGGYGLSGSALPPPAPGGYPTAAQSSTPAPGAAGHAGTLSRP